MPQDAVLPLALFMALMLSCSMHGLAASGHFPKEHRSAALSAGAGPFVLFGSLLLSFLSLATGLMLAARMIPWYAAVIGGGAMVLAAPLVLQLFSDATVNGRVALIVLSGASAVLAVSLIGMAGRL
ncbi:MAG: hypothetical protein ACLPKB_10620 [Xanthobacteraceae bacterium]